MRKLIFVFALMLITSFASAHNDIVKLPSVDNSIEKNSFYEFSFDGIYFKTCSITHNVVDEEGNIIMSVHYTDTISSGTCKGASSELIDDTYETYNELFG